MTITIPDSLAERLTTYASNRNTTPEKVAIRYISESLPSHVVETVVCRNCGKRFKPHDGRALYCSYDCYKAMPFPRQQPDLTVEKLKRTCRMYFTQKRAAEALRVSYAQFQRAIKKHNLAHCFPLKYGQASWTEGRQI